MPNFIDDAVISRLAMDYIETMSQKEMNDGEMEIYEAAMKVLLSVFVVGRSRTNERTSVQTGDNIHGYD